MMEGTCMRHIALGQVVPLGHGEVLRPWQKAESESLRSFLLGYPVY